jgi:hypothetical protein
MTAKAIVWLQANVDVASVMGDSGVLTVGSHTHTHTHTFRKGKVVLVFNFLNDELNPICHLLTLLGAHHIFHVGRIRVNQAPWQTDYFTSALNGTEWSVSRSGRPSGMEES